MSQFMAILGVIAGALMVLRLMPLVPEITQAFWLGAVGSLFLGSWPRGRGPAWETGQPDPWPSPAQQRGLVRAGGASDNGAAAEPPEMAPAAEPASPEPAPQRPSSRKRRRKKR